MDKEKQMQLIESGNFKDNNGSIMRVFNMIAHRYFKIKDIMYALPFVSEKDVIKSMDYLCDEGYLMSRTILTKEPAAISDYSYDDLEAKLTAKGIRLLECAIDDPLVNL